MDILSSVLQVLMWVPSAMAAITCLFSVIAWRRRKENGFLVLAAGFGYSAIYSLVIVAIVSSGGYGSLLHTALSRFAGWVGPTLVLIGCGLMALRRPNQPPEPTAMSVTPPAAQEPRQP